MTNFAISFAVLPLCLALLVPANGEAQTPQTASAPPPAERTTAISGYMDFHFNKNEFQDGRLDFHRFVLLITHRFSDRIRFVSELELEHALVEGLEEAGELELEQAYLDFLLSRGFNLRAGMMLVPVGIINERHEPPVYYGVERPFVDTVIVPTTWFDVGAGVHGEVGRGWRYRAYVMSPLNAREFTAEEGLRGGVQKGSDTNIGRPAVTGRVEYVGFRGLTAGASFWTGRTGFEFRPRFEVPVTLGEADVRYSRDRLELRAQFAQVAITNAGLLNDAMGRAVGVDPNVASALRGFYTEAGYRVVSGRSFGDIGLFARYENFDTQFKMPTDYLPLREFDRDGLVFGATYWPDADIAIKADYSWMRSRNSTIITPNSLNIGLGWWF
jgi:hypothetical protein